MPNTLKQNVDSVVAATSSISNAIVAKGGTVPVGAGLEEFADAIATIPSGGENNAKFKNTPTEFNPKNNLAAIEIPEGITKIATDAFYGYTYLEQIILPSTLQIINSTAFMNCTQLTTIEIPSNIQIINSMAFTGCTNLTTITVHKPEGSLSNAPWGAPNATVVWTG